MIDTQVNGYRSVDFSSSDLTVEGVRKVTRSLWKEGVFTYLATIITTTQERLMENFAVLAQATHDHEIGTSILGFHLEGPYISPDDGYRGAHNKLWIRPHDWNEFFQVNKAAKNKILTITLAPEIDSAIDFIQNCVHQGIVMALGHHNAPAEIIKKAQELLLRLILVMDSQT